MTYHAHTAPNGEYVASDDDLPGMWSHADFEGGDPDGRSYAERGWAPGAPFAQVDVEPYRRMLDDAAAEIVAYERDYLAGRIPLPLALQQIPAEGTE